MASAPWVVSDELWELVEPLLPRKERRFRYPGRKRLPDRQVLHGFMGGRHGRDVMGTVGSPPLSRAGLR